MKGRHLKDTTDRSMPYRQWRWDAKTSGCYVQDIDQIEYRFKDGVLVPVAVIELTSSEGHTMDDGLRKAIVDRFATTGQGKLLREVAKGLKCKAWAVLHGADMTELWVYNLTDVRGWWQMTPERYREWLTSL